MKAWLFFVAGWVLLVGAVYGIHYTWDHPWTWRLLLWAALGAGVSLAIESDRERR